MGVRIKANSDDTKTRKEFRKFVSQGIPIRVSTDPNFPRLYYVRYEDNFFFGVIGSKEHCLEIRREIKEYLKKELALTLNIDKTKITHGETGKALFLGYNINCMSKSKKAVACNSEEVVSAKTSNCRINAPIKQIVEKLKDKGFVSAKNKPTRNGRYVNFDLWDIVKTYKTIERGILNYYSLANNYVRVAARVHFILKYSCALTICSKMKLRTLRGVFKKYGKHLTIIQKGKVISYPSIKTYKASY
jgi:hypothetical protein